MRGIIYVEKKDDKLPQIVYRVSHFWLPQKEDRISQDQTEESRKQEILYLHYLGASSSQWKGKEQDESSLEGSELSWKWGYCYHYADTTLSSHSKPCDIHLKILLCLSNEYNMVSHWGLPFHFSGLLMEVTHVFMSSFASWVCSSLKCLFMSSAHFPIGLFDSFWLVRTPILMILLK